MFVRNMYKGQIARFFTQVPDQCDVGCGVPCAHGGLVFSYVGCVAELGADGALESKQR